MSDVAAPTATCVFTSNWHCPATNAFAMQLSVVWHVWQHASVDPPPTKTTELPVPLPETLWEASASQFWRLTVIVEVAIVVVLVV